MRGRSHRIVLLFLGASAVVVAACDEDYVCTLIVEPAIVVWVQNADTFAYEAEGAVAIAASASVVDTLVPRTYEGTILKSLQTKEAGPGRYLVTVEKDGFAPWEEGDVRVREGRCNLETVELFAELEPIE